LCAIGRGEFDQIAARLPKCHEPVLVVGPFRAELKGAIIADIPNAKLRILGAAADAERRRCVANWTYGNRLKRKNLRQLVSRRFETDRHGALAFFANQVSHDQLRGVITGGRIGMREDLSLWQDGLEGRTIAEVPPAFTAAVGPIVKGDG